MKSLLALSALSLLAALPTQAAIFGADNRMPVMPNTPFRGVQQATALGIITSMKEAAPDGSINLVAPPVGDALCPEERFKNLPSVQYSCTGFLIGPDLLVTAGHCAVNTGVNPEQSKHFCATYSWLFDYAPGFDGKTQTSGIDPSKLFRCKETIYAIKEEVFPYRDFALIRLERPATGRTPLKLSREPVDAKTVLSVVGNPMGMPTMASTNGRILVNDPKKEIMIATLDSFDGNSGSPVLNPKKEVVGILVGGFPSISFVKDKARGCRKLNRCDENGQNCLEPDADLSIFPYYQATGSEVQKLDGLHEILKRIQQ